MTDYTAAAQAIVEDRLSEAWSGAVSIEWADENALPLSVVEWRVDNPHRSRVLLGIKFRQSGRVPFFAGRLAPALTVLEAAHATGELSPGSLVLNLDDTPATRGLAFCSPDERDILIPDPVFIRRQAYQSLRQAWPPRQPQLPWGQQIPVAFWRGSTSGHPKVPKEWRTLPRLTLARSAHLYPIIDAGVTHIAQVPEGAAEEITRAGLRRGHVPEWLFHLYRAHIDIDGNSNSPGLFIKLLSGSPVLKIASMRGYRQWYYDRLKPFVHYVPVAADMSDLLQKIGWIMENGARAQAIGRAGRLLAQSMTLDLEVRAAGRRVAQALAPKQHRTPVTTEPVQQSRIIQSILEAAPEKTRLVFVHIPKCAGTDLSSKLKHFAATIHQTITVPNWTAPETLGGVVDAIEQAIAASPYILVHGHLRLHWVLNQRIARPGDRLFTIVRDPRSLLISQINYMATRLQADPGGKQPDTAGWLRAEGVASAEAWTADQIVAFAKRHAVANTLCHSLGDGTAAGALEAIRRGDIEITDTDRYAAWGEATWGLPFTTRHNRSNPIIDDVEPSMVERYCNQDIILYQLIRSALGDRLFIRGSEVSSTSMTSGARENDVARMREVSAPENASSPVPKDHPNESRWRDCASPHGNHTRD